MSSHRTAAFEAGKKLRNMPIQFVSAGRLEGTINERPAAPVVAPLDTESDDESLAPSSASSSGSHHNTNAMAHMAIRSPSPAVSEASSSADEVVFRGRGQDLSMSVATPSANKQAVAAGPFMAALAQSTPRDVAQTSFNHEEENSNAKPQIPYVLMEPKEQISTELSIRVKATVEPNDERESDADSVVQVQFAKRRGGRPAWEGTTTAWEHRSKPNIGWLPVQDRPDMHTFLRDDVKPRDAAMDDYMQNTAEFGLTNDMMAAAGFARREMDLDAGSHNDWESASGSEEEQDHILE